MTVTIVAAMGSNRAIGRGGQMPWHLPADLANFKRLTLGHPLIMGRKTFESIGRPLPGRTTIVITSQPDWTASGVRVVASLDAALEDAVEIDHQIFIVGGGQVYAEALARGVVDDMVITYVYTAPEGDTFFPEFDTDRWSVRSAEEFDGFSIQHLGPAFSG